MGAHVSVPMYRRSLPQRLRLEGRRCTACEAVLFPPLAVCPRCRGRDLEAFPLSGQGVIEAVTEIAAAGAPPEFAEQVAREGRYFVAIVRLAEGPMITAQLTGFDSLPAIGTPVAAVVRRLYTQEGVVRYGFKFGPREAEER